MKKLLVLMGSLFFLAAGCGNPENRKITSWTVQRMVAPTPTPTALVVKMMGGGPIVSGFIWPEIEVPKIEDHSKPNWPWW